MGASHEAQTTLFKQSKTKMLTWSTNSVNKRLLKTKSSDLSETFPHIRPFLTVHVLQNLDRYLRYDEILQRVAEVPVTQFMSQYSQDLGIVAANLLALLLLLCRFCRGLLICTLNSEEKKKSKENCSGLNNHQSCHKIPPNSPSNHAD